MWGLVDRKGHGEKFNVQIWRMPGWGVCVWGGGGGDDPYPSLHPKKEGNKVKNKVRKERRNERRKKHANRQRQRMYFIYTTYTFRIIGSPLQLPYTNHKSWISYSNQKRLGR